MYKKLILIVSIFSIVIFVLSCEKDVTPDTTVPPPPPPPKSFVEEFDSVGNLAKSGWVIVNNSNPIGPSSWRQGLYESGSKLAWLTDFVGFPAYSAVYSPNEFASCDLSAGSGASTLSVWLITRQMIVKNGDMLTFYTRSAGNFPDRMQVRANYTTGATNVGKSAEAVGDFSTLLLDINPGITTTGYPAIWTKYTINVTGLASAVVNARFAFRYYVTNAGPGGANSDMIGIDKMEFVSK
jgi:hypothetical protein